MSLSFSFVDYGFSLGQNALSNIDVLSGAFGEKKYLACESKVGSLSLELLHVEDDNTSQERRTQWSDCSHVN